MKSINIDYVLKKLDKSIFSRNIRLYEKLDSTNKTTKQFALEGAPEGMIVIAEEQSSGRGRMGRKWLSPCGQNLLFSILLRPPLTSKDVFALTMAFALSTCESLEEYRLRPLIKWPNDIYLEEKKLGGILTEFSLKGNKVEYVIIGLGLNVNWNPDGAHTLLYESTCIMKEAGLEIDRSKLLSKILRYFNYNYNKILRGDLDLIHMNWNNRSMLFNRRVEINSENKFVRGIAGSIERNGALIVNTDQGEKVKILNGDVSVKSLYQKNFNVKV